MHRRTRRTLWIVAAVLVLLTVAVFLRSKAPPEAARLLPESQGIGLIDAHLIASCLIHPPTLLWTADKRLSTVAQTLGIAADLI